MKFRTASEAEAHAVRRMAELEAGSSHGWERDTPTTLVCEPAPGFPCRVMVLTPPDGDGFLSRLAFTAGTKYEGRYWQGIVEDEKGLLSESALSEVDDILGVLAAVSLISLPAPNPDTRPGLLYRSKLDATDAGSMTAEIGDLIEGRVEEPRQLLNAVRELADNALFHSGADNGWCAVEEIDDQLAVTVQDQGMGIHQSMRRLYADIDERQALLLAFGGGVSATGDPIRGLGLKMVLDYTQTGAALLLETGGSAFVGTDGQGRVIGKSTQQIKGVTATFCSPARRNQNRTVNTEKS